MELSTFLFALVLLSAGIWLIYNFSGDFKEKKRHDQKIAYAPSRRPHAVSRDTRGALNSLGGMPRPSLSARKTDAPKASTVRLETPGTADQLQSLNASFVREKFETFRREL